MHKKIEEIDSLWLLVWSLRRNNKKKTSPNSFLPEQSFLLGFFFKDDCWQNFNSWKKKIYEYMILYSCSDFLDIQL